MKPRLDKLWEYINEYLEVDYGYLPKSHMDDKDDSRVDEYIQKIKVDFERMREKDCIKEESIQESIDILKGLDDI
ncbi:MAG: hypothetical protein GQ531_01155 [Sulfurovum sp.]|nr:hypothetical protein [Sulfurovum sp.]